MSRAITERLKVLSAPFKFVTVVSIHNRGGATTPHGYQSSVSCLWNAAEDGTNAVPVVVLGRRIQSCWPVRGLVDKPLTRCARHCVRRQATPP